MRMLASAGAMALVTLLNGCTTVRQAFPEQDSAQVWTALVAAAETPNYDPADPRDRWTVTENHIWVDEEHSRIEVYRELDRVLHLPRMKPRHEEQTWRFEVLFNPDSDPPIARFKGRSFAVPMQAVEEGERYFADVWALLGTPQEVVPREPQLIEPGDEPVERDEEDRPIIDLDELEPVPPGR